MGNNTLVLILAAGKGTRLKSNLPKPLVEVAGIPMIHRILNVFQTFPDIDVSIVVGHRFGEIMKAIEGNVHYIYQHEQRGTAHAVKQAASNIKKYNKVIIMTADSALITRSVIIKLLNSHHKSGADCSFLSSEFPFYLPYARVIRKDGSVISCIEERDADENQRKIKELFTSHYLLNTEPLLKYIHHIKVNPVSREYYLTDIVNIMIQDCCKVNAVKIRNYHSLIGINTVDELKFAEKWINTEVVSN